MVKSVKSDVGHAGSRLIKRPRLTKLLDRAAGPLILLIAPAGYGKTTLARQWLEQGGRRGAWYAGSPASSDVAALAAGLSRAMNPIRPDVGKRAVERIRVSKNPQSEARLLAEMFAEDVVDWPEGAWLAVDDYQFLIEAPEAEAFFEIIATTTSLPILVTSRERPRWATARLSIYGYVIELDQNALAFTRAEARRVLRATDAATAPDVIEVADGWPAVLGLAAAAHAGRSRTIEEASELYAFLADELYDRAPPSLQKHVLEMALVPTLTADLAIRLFGFEAQDVIDRARSSGFLTGAPRGDHSIHPLLRRVLRGKIAMADRQQRNELVEEVGNVLVAAGEWDATFDLVEEFGLSALLINLVESSLHRVLAEGRLATLERWVGYGRAHDTAHSIIDIADAELAFRRGEYFFAEELAASAARQIGPHHELASATWLIAGRCAHLDGRDDQALDYLHHAERSARSSQDLERALWGQLMSCLDLERPPDRVLGHLRQAAGRGSESQLRVVLAEGMVSARKDAMAGTRRLRSGLRLLPRVDDPLLCSNLLNQLAYYLMLGARYSESLNLSTQCLEIAAKYRLPFVRAHVLTTVIAAHLGRSDLAGARVNLGRLHEALGRVSDPHVLLNAHLLQARLLVSQARFAEARVQLDVATTEGASLAVVGERGAMTALVSACLGERERATDEASRAESLTNSIETRALSACVRAVLALQASAADADEIEAEFASVARTGAFDYLVLSYRGFPPLLPAAQAYLASELAVVLREAGDFALAKRWGVPVPARARSGTRLTDREREVHALLAQGMTNREIAQRLFISESTAKVHVRNILEKLGARSRTEAALYAVADQTTATAANSDGDV